MRLKHSLAAAEVERLQVFALGDEPVVMHIQGSRIRGGADRPERLS